MRVQFLPWQTYSITGSNCKGEDEAVKPAKKRKGRTSLQEDCKDAVAMSLCMTTTSRKKKQNVLFQPIVCVTRSHSVFLLGDTTTNEKNSTNDNNEEQTTLSSQNNYHDENHSTQLTVPKNKTWTSKPGLSHSFVPEEQQNHPQGRVAIVPAVFSSSYNNNSNFVAAFQHNNTTVCFWDAKVGPCDDDDDNIQRLKLPNHLFGTSLQFVLHPNNWLFLIGTMNDGSIFLLDCSAATKELQILPNDDSSNKACVSNETFLHCMTSHDGDFLQVHLLSMASEDKVKKTCLVIRTFSVSLSPVAHDDGTTRSKWIRTNVVPLTLSSSNGTSLGDKAFETKTLHLQVDSACTLRRGSTVAILMQLVSTKQFYIHVVDVANGELVGEDPIAIPSFYEADPCHHSDNENNNNNKTLSMGCVTPDHIVLVSNHLLAVLDRRYNGSIIYQTSVVQIFGGESTPASVMKIVQSDSSSRSLILSLTDNTNDNISMAYSKFSSSDQERITMASALTSAIATSAIFSNTTFSQETTTSAKCQVTLRCEKQIAYLQSCCDDFLQSKVTTKNGTIAFTWDSLFEEAMLDVYHAIGETQSMPSKKANGEEIKCHTMLNGSLSVAYHKDETKSREKLPYDPRLEDLLVCAAEGSVRILIHEFLQGERKNPSSTLANGKQNIAASTRSANMNNSTNAKAAINVFVKCCSLTKISMRQLNSIVAADTENNCKSVVQFLCRAGLIQILHFVLGNCNEASERDLVYALSYMLCSATLDDLISFYLSLDDGFCDSTSVLCNGIGKEMPQDHKNTELASEGTEGRTSLSATYGDDLLIRKLMIYSKQFTKANANENLASSSSEIVSKIIQHSSLFWSRFIVGKCATGLNPSLLRSAIIQCLIMSSKGVAQNDNLEIILLSMTHLLREVVAGRLVLLPLPSRETPPGAHKRVIEWIEALLDAIQFCSVTASSEDRFCSSTDSHSLSQVQLILKAVLGQVKKLMLVENVVSLSMAGLCRGVKRRQGELTDGELATTKSRDSASKTIPLYSIERLRF